MKMYRSWRILLFFPVINFISCENNKNLLSGVVNLFKSMDVHTVWANTCWDTIINIDLLKRLSNEDISISFDLRKMGMVQQTHKTWYKSGMLVDLSCDQASDVLQQASNDRLFNLQNVWILFNQEKNPNQTDPLEIARHTFRTHMNKSYVLPDSRVYLLIEIDNISWAVWDGFRLSVSEEIQVSEVGVITPDRVEIECSDRTNFHRVVIRASTVILEPKDFLGWDKPVKGNLDTFAHVHYAISIVLAEQLNFTLNLTLAPDYGWNYGNGTYSGMIGQLQREEIDFTAAGGLMRADRMDAGDVTVGTIVARTLAIFRQPPLSSVNNVFTLPFTLGVWMLLLVMLFVFTAALIYLTWASNKLKGRKTELSTGLDTVNMVLGAICQQGLTISGQTLPARMATFVLFMSVVFLFTSYAASIVVLLQSTSQTIKTVKDLADKPITFSVQDTKHNYIYFNETTDENIKKIYVEKIKPQGKNGFTSPEIGVNRVRNEFHSYLIEISLANHIIANTWKEHEKCSLSEIELYKIPLLTLYVVKKSGYKDVFKQKMIHQYEIGLKYRIFKNTMPQKQKCDSANQGIIYFNSVSLKEVYPALLFLGYGMCFSIILFLFEHVYEKEVTKKKKIDLSKRS